MPDYKKELEHIGENNARIMRGTPQVGKAFMDMYGKAGEGRSIDAKHKALMALGMAIAIRCEGCILMHVQSAIANGATMADIADTVEVALMMCGGPAMVHGGKAIEAAEEFLGGR